MILCRNGHPNEDGATYCAVCKVYIDSTAQAVVTAPEPPTPQTSESPLSAELIPQVSAGRVNGEHVLTLRNTGAQTAISEPAVAETDGDVNVVLDPSTIAIERGETASARVRVTPKRPLWLGRRRTHRFGLNVSPGVSVAAAMVQKSRIPPWTLLAAVIPILVVIFLLISSGSDTVAGRVIARLPLNVRAEPSDNSKIIGDLPSGTEVRISCQTADSRDRLWDRLASPFSGGYVFDRFVRRTEDPKRCT
jgi:hypothetical protein